MKQKMTGVILISVGLIVIVAGIIILSNSKKERVNLNEEKQLITEVATEDDEITVSNIIFPKNWTTS